jgi:hypothetical protein
MQRSRLADPAAWRELKALFRELANREVPNIDGRVLCAHWNPNGFSGPDEQWQLGGNTNEHVRKQFKRYAARGAVLLGESIKTATLFFWLDRLRENSPFFSVITHATSEGGIIECVCLASADYCYELETEALSAQTDAARPLRSMTAVPSVSAQAPAGDPPHPAMTSPVSIGSREKWDRAEGEPVESKSQAAPLSPEERASWAEKLEALSAEDRASIERSMAECSAILVRSAKYQKGLLRRLGVRTDLDDFEEFWLQMRAAAHHVGFSFKEFWQLTPREICASLELKARELDLLERAGQSTSRDVGDRSVWKVSAQPDDPVQENPFSKDDQRHKVWEKSTRSAELELHRLKQEILGRPQPKNVEQDQDLHLEFIFRRFQIWAKRGISVVWSYSCVRAYEAWLASYFQAEMKLWREQCPRGFNSESFLSELEKKLLQACAYWSGNAMENVAALEAQGLVAELIEGPQSGEIEQEPDPRRSAPLRFASNSIAPSKSTPVRSASLRSAPLICATLAVAPAKRA